MAKRKKSTAALAAAEKASGEAAGAGFFADFGELAALGRENFTAFWRANEALSEAFEAIGDEVLGYVRTAFENAAGTATALLGAKTLEDVFQLNADFAAANIAGLIERSAKFSEIGAKVANEALVPLGGRVEATLHKFTKPLAA